MSLRYNRQEIEVWLGAHTVAKARAYQNAVSHLAWENASTLTGKVQGREHRPYTVRVVFHDVDDGMWIDGHCSCPIGIDCKHVAALLLAATSAVQPAAAQPAATGIRPELVSWLDAFRSRQSSLSDTRQRPASAKNLHAIAYLIAWSQFNDPEVLLYKARVSVEGAIRSFEDPWHNVEQALIKPPKFVAESDLPILRGLWLNRTRQFGNWFQLRGSMGADILAKMVATGRSFVLPEEVGKLPEPSSVLRLGPSRTGKIIWRTLPDSQMVPAVQSDPPATLLLTPIEPCWYLDAQSGEAGPVDLPWPADRLRDFLSIPGITLDESALVANVLREVLPDFPLPPGQDKASIDVIDIDPIPVLSLDTLPVYSYGWPSLRTDNELDFATVAFDYAGHRIEAHNNTSLVQSDDGAILQVKRKPSVEKRFLTALKHAGTRKVPSNVAYGPHPFPTGILGLAEKDDWPAFMTETLPTLREQGWQVEMTPGFRFNVIEVDAIDGDLRQAKDGWFDLEMGITVNDRKVRLEPLLAELFRRDRRWLQGDIDAIADDQMVELKTDREERLLLRADRLKPVVRVLIDLFDGLGRSDLRIAPLDVKRIAGLDQAGRWEFHGDASLRQLVQRLMAGPGVVSVPVPRGLQATLRPYQHEGLNWMQYLRENALSGVLADDMGLGKTVQTLAHILTEKESGRLDLPVLIVMPTTLIHNWKEEAQRFAPALRVLDLHGPLRHERFDQIGNHDLILTTYPLVWRDSAALAQHEYHMLVLDEAQNVKNANTRAAATIRDIRARHRLCLTGTPLENHLGELWAQFDFLLPGFLGSRQDFTRRWRTPIEKGGDKARRELLARRIRPFMLRRRKDEVAKELPPKSTIVRTIELDGAQRDLYETVRSAMQEKIRAVITQKGLARSHIVVLDALLKLRQVCCDPRLVNLQQAAGVKESAKLTLLLEMLPGLIEEGRRILLFSQFTGMLGLIATALDEADIPFVMLTGETSDRITPVKQFMEGQVPLFLISLKAGGVGLNLTAADTVIHYDPWWNPAAENQATDRAHRIGQDKPVFVYKLITAGSVEEKIVAMQEKKAALADAILSDSGTAATGLSKEDLDALFEPIPDMSSSEKPAPGRSRRKGNVAALN
jgi:superfamily II DNA or RNA helicase